MEHFYEYQSHILTLPIFWRLHYIKQEAILKRLQETFEAEIGELQRGSPAVMHS